MINPKYIGPEIPGLVFVGNSHGNTENEAIVAYQSRLNDIPPDCFRVIAVEYDKGIKTPAVYVEVEYTEQIKEWHNHILTLLEAFRNLSEDY